jgi:hypothetical protein
MARWLRQQPHRDAVRDLLFASSFRQREIVPAETLQWYWDQHQAGTTDFSWLLYRLLSLELWYQMYIDRWQPMPAVPPHVFSPTQQSAAA